MNRWRHPGSNNPGWRQPLDSGSRLEPVYDLRSSNPRKAKWIICKLALLHGWPWDQVVWGDSREAALSMPNKHNTPRRHHIPKMKFRVKNWAEYDAGLRHRGSLTLWVTPEVLDDCRAARRTTPGGQSIYSELAIETGMMLRLAFHLALRHTEGLMAIASVTADGAYDGMATYDVVTGHREDVRVIIPPHVTAVLSAEVEHNPSQRGRHILSIVARGRLAWLEETDYPQRVLVETAMGRYQAIIGPCLRARCFSGQTAEAAVGIAVLNRMLDAGRPDSVRRMKIAA